MGPVGDFLDPDPISLASQPYHQHPSNPRNTLCFCMLLLDGGRKPQFVGLWQSVGIYLINQQKTVKMLMDKILHHLGFFGINTVIHEISTISTGGFCLSE